MREPTDAEKADFVPLFDKPKKSVEDTFLNMLGKKQQEALKKGLPFCDRAAKDDFYDYYNEQTKLSMRKNGYVKVEEIKPIKIDWEKYSELKNFELTEEDEKRDSHLSDKHRIPVYVKFKVYKFKGYSNIYRVMEDSEDAIARARKVVDKK